MTGIKTAEGIGDAYDGTIQCVIGIAHCFNKGFTQEKGKFFVAVSRKALAHATFWGCHEKLPVNSCEK